MKSSLGSAARPVPRRSLCEQVFDRLADEIVLGQLAPGTRLDEHVIAKRCGVSRTPVREALKQLVATGLAHCRPNCGSVVCSLTATDLDLMFEAIAELESACARYAALRMNALERVALQACYVQGQEAAHAQDKAGCDRFNQDFHALIFNGARNPFLQESMVTLQLRVMPFRRGQFANPERLEQSVVEHSRVVHAIVAGDAEAASREMRNHLLSVRQAASRLSLSGFQGAAQAAF